MVCFLAFYLQKFIPKHNGYQHLTKKKKNNITVHFSSRRRKNRRFFPTWRACSPLITTIFGPSPQIRRVPFQTEERASQPLMQVMWLTVGIRLATFIHKGLGANQPSFQAVAYNATICISINCCNFITIFDH